MTNNRTRHLAEISVFTALAFVFSNIPLQTANAAFELSLALIPIAILGIRCGIKAALISGFLFSLLTIVSGKAYFYIWWQGILEYPIACSFLGFFGIFKQQIRNAFLENKRKTLLAYLLLTTTITCFFKWFCHFIAGAFYWAMILDPVPDNIYLYSLIPNGASFVANAIFLFVVLSALFFTAPHLFISKDEY